MGIRRDRKPLCNKRESVSPVWGETRIPSARATSVGRATLEAGQWLGVLDEAARLEVEHGSSAAIYELISDRPLQGTFEDYK